MSVSGSDELLDTPAGLLRLQRLHAGDPSLRAWDAADELLLAEAAQRLKPGDRVLVLEDAHGALTLGLWPFEPVSVSDSAALPQAVAHNLSLNPAARAGPSACCLSWLDLLGADGCFLHGYGPDTTTAGAVSAPGSFDAVILRVPRQSDYLEFLLRFASRQLKPGGLLLTGGMIKHIPDQSVAIYQRLVITEQVLPARKKARVVVCRPGPGNVGDGAWDALWKGYRLQDQGLTLQGLPSVFGREKLDIGTRMLLPHLEQAMAGVKAGERVLDLACGNGVLGLIALARKPEVQVSFADVSAQALLSVRHNLNAAGFGNVLQQTLIHADGLPVNVRQQGFARVLLNPPFHEGGVVGDHIARRLFDDAAAALAPDGLLLMVGNRHLGYHRTLRQTFDEVGQWDADPKFVVLAGRRPRRQRVAAGRS